MVLVGRCGDPEISGGRECPAGVGLGESKGDEAAEVDGGGAVVKPGDAINCGAVSL